MKQFKRRSLLFIPAIRDRYYKKINSTNCDAVIFDLEDSIPSFGKEKARELLKRNFDQFRNNDKELIIRVNDCRSEYIEKDLNLVSQLNPDTVMVAKCDKGDIERVENALGTNNELNFMPLIETVSGYMNAKAIFGASKKNSGVVFGAEDFSADVGIQRAEYHQNLIFPQVIVNLILLSKYFDLDFIDAVYPYLSTDEAFQGLIDEATFTKKMGAIGKLAVHVSQVDAINKVYTPNRAELKKTRMILSELDRAEKEKELSVFEFHNRMMDTPERKRAQKIFKQIERFDPNFETEDD